MALRNNLNENLLDDAAKQQGGGSNLVVRVEQDPDNNLQALFDTVLKPGDSKRPLQVPFRMRNLPTSFFTPPSAGTPGGCKSPSTQHSRENSTDSAFSTGSQSASAATSNAGVVGAGQTPALNNIRKGIVISHSRAHSSPAQLQQTYEQQQQSAAAQQSQQKFIKVDKNSSQAAGAQQQLQQQQQQAQPQVVHSKQRSYDVVSSIRLHNDLGELPRGWEQAKTSDGQVYYINHILKSTQWEDPRLNRPQSQLTPQLEVTKTEEVSSSKDDTLGPLPEGWECAKAESGETYFINHRARTTSWIDPRLPEFLQRNTISSPLTAGGTNISSEFYNNNILRLEKECEQMKQRQAEIQHQDLLSRQSQQAIGLQMDPFLSEHARQESADSGLSLSSNNFMAPEFLSTLDDSMDCGYVDTENLDDIGLDNTDNLVSSLQLNDSLCHEMLSDVQSLINPSSNKGDSVEWYKMI